LREFVEIIQHQPESPRLEALLQENDLSVRVADDIRRDPTLKAEIIQILESRIQDSQATYEETHFERIYHEFEQAMVSGNLSLALKSRLVAHPEIVSRIERKLGAPVTGELEELIENYKFENYTSQCQFYHQPQFCLEGAAQYGDLEKVRQFIDDPEIEDPNQPLALAAGNGHIHVVEFLLSLKDTIDDIQGAAEYAAESGHLKILKLLMASGKPYQIENILYSAIVGGHIGIVEFLLPNPDIGNLNQTIAYAAKFGKLDIFKLLISDNRVTNLDRAMINLARAKSPFDLFLSLVEDPRVTNLSQAVQDLVEYVDINTVISLISHPKVTQFNPGGLMRRAYITGDLDIIDTVKSLVDHPKVTNLNSMLSTAVHYGDLEFVQQLLNENPKVNNIADAEVMAVRSDNNLILEFMLGHHRVSGFDRIIYAAISQQRTDIIKMVILHPRFIHDPNYIKDQTLVDALRFAAGAGDAEVVGLLAANPRIAHLDSAMAAAVYANHVQIVEMLMLDPRVEKLGEYIDYAAKHGRVDTVKVLLDNPRITDLNSTLAAAVHSGNIDLVRLILNDPRVTNTDEASDAALEEFRWDMMELLPAKFYGI